MNVLAWNSSVDGLLSEASLRKKLERLGYGITRYVYPPCRVHSAEVEGNEPVVSLDGIKALLRH